MREGNKLADCLANQELDKGNIDINSFQQLEQQVRRLVNMDKLQCPYIRVKEKKS